MRPRFALLTLRGFKTIRELRDFQPGRLTVLTGANGAGKSNFISFFSMLSAMVTAPGNLQPFITREGGASKVLHDGSTKTLQMEASLLFETENGQSDYSFRLFHAAHDSLIFADEAFGVRKGKQSKPSTFGAGHKESRLIGDAEGARILPMLRRITVHQFNNTSGGCRMRDKWDAADGKALRDDGSNIGPFLYRLKSESKDQYLRIVATLQQLLPYFSDFELDPEYGKLILRWREKGSDQIFNASQASDGMLRVMALVALLQQPEADLPDVIMLDEPELGLHPNALGTLAELIQNVARQSQVIMATQSPSLILKFDSKDIVELERVGRETQFRGLQLVAVAS